MRLTVKQQKALQVISDAGYVTAGWFATQMGYGGHRVKGRTGASVLRRLQSLGWVQMWDEWYGSVYVTTAKLTPAGQKALESTTPTPALEKHTSNPATQAPVHPKCNAKNEDSRDV